MKWAQRTSALRPLPTGQASGVAGSASLPDSHAQGAVLVVTCRFDPHADAVIAALETLGVVSCRLNSEDLLTTHTVSWCSEDSEDISLACSGNHLSLPSEILGGYFRTPDRVASPSEVGTDAARAFASSEGDALLNCIYAIPCIRWVPSPHTVRIAEAKIPQLILAKRLGLRIPRTIVTNDPVEARDFVRRLGRDIAVKPLLTPNVCIGDHVYDVFAQRLPPDQLEDHIESIRWAPTILQEYIPKVADVRVTIIGQDIFAVEIDSQSVSGGETDWRQLDPFSIPHRSITLPPSLIALLRRFLDSYNLIFGAIDLIRTRDGEYVFLENNPNGQWYWLEVLTGLPMAASMARLLTSGKGL